MAIQNNQIGNSNIDNDEISLKELILKMKELGTFLKSKSKLILIAGFIGALIGLTIALFEKPTYKSVLTFAMEEEKGGGGGISSALGLASSFGIDLGGGGGGGAFAASNIAELMKSRLLVEKALLEPVIINGKTISLAEYYIQIYELRDPPFFWQPPLNEIHFLPGTERSNFTLQQDSLLYEIHKSLIKENLTISQKEKKISILTIEVNTINELFSKIFCESLAKETSNFYIETKSKKSKLNVNVLQRQTDSVRNSLNGAITGVASETDNVYNMNPAFNTRGAPSKKKQIDVQVNTAILTNLVVQLELAKITLRKETPLIQLIDRPILPLEKEKLGKLKSIILGGLLAAFIYILYLIYGRLYRKIVS